MLQNSLLVDIFNVTTLTSKRADKMMLEINLKRDSSPRNGDFVIICSTSSCSKPSK